MSAWIEVDLAIIALVGLLLVVVAKPEIEGQAATYTPVILNEAAICNAVPGIAEDAIYAAAADFAEQELRKVGTGAGRQLRVGGKASECVVPDSAAPWRLLPWRIRWLYPNFSV